MSAVIQEPILVAVYERVSSDDQRDRETIKTQTETVDRFLTVNPQYQVYRRYLDDGVSGTIPLRQRPQGSALVRDAIEGRFKKLLITRASRLSRDEIDALSSYALFESLGVELIGISEPVSDRTMFGFTAVMHASARRQFLADSARGMERAAREGRYTGGIVPLGYAVAGKKQTARLVPSDEPMWGDLSAADIVRRMYQRVGNEGWTCQAVADEFNHLGIPTVYVRDGRQVKERQGTRYMRTQGLWSAGRIRNILVNPVYKGELHYGRRANRRGREVISAQVPALVSRELWEEALRSLATHRIMAKNTDQHYLLTSIMRCATCGSSYVNAPGHGGRWYRCNGRMRRRDLTAGRCSARAIKAPVAETLVWQDVLGFLEAPGALLEELMAEQGADQGRKSVEAEVSTLQKALQDVNRRIQKAADLALRDLISEEALAELMPKLKAEKAGVERRLKELQPPVAEAESEVAPDLIHKLRQRLREGLTDQQKQEIARVLVKRITVFTEKKEDKPMIRLLVEYRFPLGAVNLGTDRGSWLRQA